MKLSEAIQQFISLRDAKGERGRKTATRYLSVLRMVNRSVCEVMRMLSNQAGLPTVINAHRARHAMGRDAAKTLRSDTAVANILGHSNVESSYIYTMTWGEDLKREWEYVMKKRGVPMGRPPRTANNFPKFRQSRPSTLPGRLRPQEVATSRYGRMAK